MSQAQHSWARKALNWATQLPLYDRVKFKPDFVKKLCLNINAHFISIFLNGAIFDRVTLSTKFNFQMHFSCVYLSKYTTLLFDEDAVFWPETTLLYGWVLGYHENVIILVNNQSHGWIQCIFWCHLIKFTNFGFDKNAVSWSETTRLDRWVEGFSKNGAMLALN